MLKLQPCSLSTMPGASLVEIKSLIVHDATHSLPLTAFTNFRGLLRRASNSCIQWA